MNNKINIEFNYNELEILMQSLEVNQKDWDRYLRKNVKAYNEDPKEHASDLLDTVTGWEANRILLEKISTIFDKIFCKAFKSNGPIEIDKKDSNWKDNDEVYYPSLYPTGYGTIEIAIARLSYENVGHTCVAAGIGFHTEKEAKELAKKWLDEAKQNKQSK